MEGSAASSPDRVAHGIDPDALLRRADASLLVLAPHPDDESLAAGGLIQRALAHGARVGVVFVSDGENNPWPQRALERRVWIGARQRTAWGARRRGEGAAAIDILGVDPARVQRLGWPDGRVTAMLLERAPAMLAELRELFARERPTLLVLPDLADRHPDHAALHVLVELALAGMAVDARPLRLGYVLHGRARADASPTVSLALSGDELAGKRRAIEAHASQMALGRRRFMRFAREREGFSVASKDGVPAGTVLPWLPPRALRPFLSLLVVDADGAACVPLGGGDANLSWRDGSPAACLSRPLRSPTFVKLTCRVSSPWVFDHWGWCRIGAPAMPH